MILIKAEFNVGTDIHKAAEKMCEYARLHNVGVAARFNGVSIWAYPHSQPYQVVEYYQKEQK